MATSLAIRAVSFERRQVIMERVNGAVSTDGKLIERVAEGHHLVPRQLEQLSEQLRPRRLLRDQQDRLQGATDLRCGQPS